MNSILARWISAYVIYGDPVICLFSVFASLKYIFLFLACYTLQVEFFLLIFFDLLAVHLLNFK